VRGDSWIITAATLVSRGYGVFAWRSLLPSPRVWFRRLLVHRREGSLLRYGIILSFASCANLAILAIGLARYPLIFAQERTGWVTFDVLILVAYASVGVLASRVTDGALARAIRLATWLGGGAGLILSADVTREYFADAGPAIGFGVGLTAFVAALVMFAVAGGRGTDGSYARAAVAGVWSAMVCMMLLLIYAWLLNYVFMDYLARILVNDPEYLRGNTLTDPASYTVWNTLSALASHGVLLPLLGAILGPVGAWISGRLTNGGDLSSQRTRAASVTATRQASQGPSK